MMINRCCFGVLWVCLFFSPVISFASEQKFTIVDAERNGLLGFSASIDGGVAFAGAPAQVSKPGTGYLFDVHTGQPTHTLTPSVSRADDLFGFNAKVTGNSVLVGDPGNPFASTKIPGAAYLFDVNTGTESMRLTPDDSFAGDEFGFGINAIDELAIIGAPNLGQGQGAAYLFDLDSGLQLQKLTALDPLDGAEFGADVAVSEQFAVVGAPGNFDTLGFVPGFAYVFDVATGQQLHKLQPSDGFGGDEFGFDVAIDGNVAVIGAPNGGSGVGAAYLFDVSTGQQLAKLLPEASQVGDDFGGAVDIQGGAALVGASGLNSVLGAAYLFDTETGQQTQKFVPADIELRDGFGVSVSISENRVFIGAPQDDDTTLNAGAAYLYSIAGLEGDFNNDGELDVTDIDLLTQAVNTASHPAEFDLNADSFVDHQDRTIWVEQLAYTYFGDGNLDGQFGTGDLILALSAAEYEDGIPHNSGWAEGDWDGDLDFGTSDLVAALQTGAYEQGPRSAMAAVPEPNSLVLIAFGLLGVLRFRAGRATFPAE